MNPVTFAMTGLVFALWLNALNLLGIAAEPAQEGAPHPARTVAAAGSLVGAITLIIAPIWLFVGAPFGMEAWGIHSLFSGTMAMYGLLWLGVFAMQWYGLDPRPIGNLCLLLLFMQIIHMFGYAQLSGMATVHDWITQIVLFSYVVLLYMFFRLLNGKFSPRVAGVWAMVTVITTLYLLYFSGNIFPTP